MDYSNKLITMYILQIRQKYYPLQWKRGKQYQWHKLNCGLKTKQDLPMLYSLAEQQNLLILLRGWLLLNSIPRPEVGGMHGLRLPQCMSLIEKQNPYSFLEPENPSGRQRRQRFRKEGAIKKSFQQWQQILLQQQLQPH